MILTGILLSMALWPYSEDIGFLTGLFALGACRIRS